MQSWPNGRLSRNLFGGTDEKQEESQGGRKFFRQNFKTGTSEYGVGVLHGLNKAYALLLNFQTIKLMALCAINHRCHGMTYSNYFNIKNFEFCPHCLFMCLL